MNYLRDIITYVRRIVKSPTNSQLTDDLIIDYVNRFYTQDVSLRMELFDLKKLYQFETYPGVTKYNMPLYSVQLEPDGNTTQAIGMYPVYQGFKGPAFINGVPVSFNTLKGAFYRLFPNVIQQSGIIGVGDGTTGPYTLQFPFLTGTAPQNPPINGLERAHIDISGIISTGNNIDPPVTDDTGAEAAISGVPTTSIQSQVFITSLGSAKQNVIVQDSGWWLNTDYNCGLLMAPGKAPKGNTRLTGAYSSTNNVVNYITGKAYVTFPIPIPIGQNILGQVRYFQSGLPRGILYYDNVIELRMPPDKQYLVELEAYLTPAAFLSSSEAIPFAYMSEYIARGAAQKILSDIQDMEAYNFYLPLFREQELLVWKRSERQFTATRTPTLYSQGKPFGTFSLNNVGGGLST